MRKLVLLCFLLALPLAAQETRYRLERVIVEGSPVSDHIVREEARLVEERDYTEDDFRQALYRIRRLPFVTDAAYRIEAGISAGSSVLVIRILDERPVFYDATFSASSQERGDTSRDYAAAVGGRYLLDDLGVVETRVQTLDVDDGGSLTLTYRGYGFGDQGVFVISSLEQRFGAEARTYDPTPSFTLGLPLTRQQTLTLSAARAKSRIITSFDVKGDDDPDDDDTFDDNVDLADRTHLTTAALQWHYETFDDPIFATHGIDVSAGPFWIEDSVKHDVYDPEEKEVTGTETTSGMVGVNVDATAWRPIAGRNVLSLGIAANATERAEEREWLGQARASFAHDFHTQSERQLRPWRARVEIGGGYRRTSGGVDQPLADAAFVMRHRWGTLRLAGTYLWQ
ncbi:MAG TPA: hypothetical protein VGF48_09995 [Thermoanaerobaculia bacterium]|jgi:hypothetical protein